MLTSWFLSAINFRAKFRKHRRGKQSRRGFRNMFVEPLGERKMMSAVPGLPNPNEVVQTGFTAAQLASSLVGAGVTVSNAVFTGAAAAQGTFNFTDPTVIGFGQGLVLSSGNAADVVGPNTADFTSTDFGNPGDANLTALSGYDTHDAAVLEFDFVPTANQVSFQYSFASDEYPEWVNTPFNDVFAFFVNGTNYATVRQTAGDPNAPSVPVAVNNINNGNPLDPNFTPARPDLFRPNYVDPNGGPSAINLELDGITHVLNFQAPVTPGVVNHMKLAIADASDGIYDSAVFIQAGSLVSNANPVADLSIQPQSAAEPNKVTAVVEAEDPNGLALTYTINWGDGTSTSGPLDGPQSEKTALVDHLYAAAGDYNVTLSVSNGALSGTGTEDVHIPGTGTGTGNTSAAPVVISNPVDQAIVAGSTVVFTAAATGTPAPSVQWQVSTDSGLTYTDIAGATQTTYSAVANATDNGSLYQAVFTNSEGQTVTTAALLTVNVAVQTDTTPPDAPLVSLAQDTGASAADQITSVGLLALGNIETGATVEYSVDGGNTWLADFTAVEGQNSVAVRQIDEAGNISDVSVLDFVLDTQAPTAVAPALVNDTGSSNTDHITSNGSLVIGGAETNAVVQYSVDGGTTWSGNFTAVEGLNSVAVRQIDLAGNISDVSVLNLVLDTQAPTTVAPALVNDTGSSNTDHITNNGSLVIGGAETGATIQYSVDGGKTWSGNFTATQGANTVQVRQTDLAGNVSGATALSFTLDTVAPTAPKLALQQDTGASATDNITKVGTLLLSGTETGATVEYSGDNGATWSGSYLAKEGLNTVSVRQTDVAGNISAIGKFSFTLDTTAPKLNPVFSTGTQPILVNAKGVTVAPNATDAGGIASQSAGAVNAATAGKKSLTCTATDLAGNTTTVTVSYAIGYALQNVKPAAGATFTQKSSIPVSFQLSDANGLLSDTAAANLASSISITFDGKSFSGVSYDKKTHTFSLNLKISKMTTGAHTVGIHVLANGAEVATANTNIKVV